MNNNNKIAFFTNLHFIFSNIFNKSTSLLITHRKKIRTKLEIKTFPNQILLTGLPIILGFYQFLYNKYPNKMNLVFFEKNIPILSYPVETITWETFKYFNFPNTITLTANKFQTDSQKKLQNTTINFEWNDQAFLIYSLKTNTTNNELGTYIVPKKSPISLNRQISSQKPINADSLFKSYYYFSLIENKPVSNFSLGNHDDIPVKLGSFSIEKQTVLFKKLVSYEKTIGTPINNKKQFGTLVENTNNLGSTLRGFKSWSQNFSENVLPSLDENTIKFFKNHDLLNKEFRTLFVNFNVLPFSEKYIDFFALANLKTFDSAYIKELIQYLDNFLISPEQQITRKMSGYRYPDMLFEDIQFLKNNLQIKNLTTFKISLPPNYLISQKSQLINPESKPFLVKVKNFALKSSDENTIIYSGPGLVLNKLTGLDWEIVSKNPTKTNLREWLQKQLGNNNPLTDKYINFFGLLESPEISTKDKNKTLNILNENQILQKISGKDARFLEYWIKNLPIFQDKYINIAHSTENFLGFNRKFYLPFITTPTLQQTNIVLKDELSSKKLLSLSDEESKNLNYSFSNLFLPIVETRIPSETRAEALFGFNLGLDFTFNYPFVKNNHISSKFSPNTLSALNDQSFETFLVSGIYKNEPNLNSTNGISVFFDIWEPLSFQSWLITTQLGFAVLVFQVLKALIDNYGKELLVYLLDLVAILGFVDENIKQEIEILMGQREKGFRIISQISKNFTNIAGIKSLLPEIIEIVWFLRNSGREFSFSNTIPRGILLTGPPGTGKTLLVQAIAGEANVPVVALSGSSLLEPGESGAVKLELVFEEARRLAPCIVFIDEVDSVAQKREQVVSNPMGEDEVLESLESIAPINSGPILKSKQDTDLTTEAAFFKHQKTEKEKLRILTQFLIELDGIKSREGVVVIGATNYPEILDAAILRPGRFDRIVEVALPTPEKRQSIFQLYSRPLGTVHTIPWDYLVRRTAGYSAADLASLMNQSTLYAILNGTKHTLETIEYGIDRLTTIGFVNPIKKEKNTLDVYQLAYYQTGKVLLGILLEHNPSSLVIHLWPKTPNSRSIRIQQNLQNYFFRFARQVELEHRVIGCYAGKAAEILFLQKSHKKENLSDFGLEDIKFGQSIIKLMVENWYLFSRSAMTKETTEIFSDYNKKEYRGIPQKFGFYSPYIDELDTDEIENPKVSSETSLVSYTEDVQNYSFTTVLQDNVSEEFELSTRLFSNWYRLYLPDPQKNERNIEWIPPEEFYHGNRLPKTLTNYINWNDLSKIDNDYQTHSLILQSFNKAFILLDTNRELLDKLTYELISKEILREADINEICKKFSLNGLSSNLLTNKFLTLENPICIQRSWGKNSRRKKSRWIKNFELSSSLCFEFVFLEFKIHESLVSFFEFIFLEFKNLQSVMVFFELGFLKLKILESLVIAQETQD